MARSKLFLVLSAAAALSACSETPQAAAPAAPAPVAVAPVEAPAAKAEAKPELVNISQAASLFQAKAVPVDANSPDTRKEYGVIPGARLLSSSSDYDCASELPSDKGTPLVFYCGNEHCSASDAAAERALSAGYSNVKVLRAGILGWKESGQKTDSPAS